MELDDIREQVGELIENVKREYGELRVQANLGRKEAADELKVLEGKLQKLEAKAKELGGATVEASRDIGAAAVLLGQEIRDGIRDIAKRF